jgi:hypothetical protein
MTTAQDLLAWLDARGYYVDWRRDPSLAVEWCAALNPFAWNRITREGMEDLAVKASLELAAVVTAKYTDSPAFVSFRGVACDGDVKHGKWSLSDMHSLILWYQEGHKLCQVIILYNE